MRILLVAAAVALSITAAQAQEMVGNKPADRAAPAAAAVPTSSLVEQLKAAGELKDPKALEAPALKIDAADTKPGETKPVAAKPAEAPALAAKPVESKAVESKASETRPAQAVEAKPVKKRVVKRRETDEQKARRIAAKYGISW